VNDQVKDPGVLVFDLWSLFLDRSGDPGRIMIATRGVKIKDQSPKIKARTFYLSLVTVPPGALHSPLNLVCSWPSPRCKSIWNT